MPGRPITEVEFWDLVEVTGDCWLWLGSTWANGYGRRGDHYTHVLAWEFTNMMGKPDGFDLHHKCHVRLCVRPDHLELLPIKVHRGLELRERTRCPKGHPFDEENTYFYVSEKTQRGGRQCRSCNAYNARERRKSAS